MGIVSVCGLTFPLLTVYIYGIIPVPMAVLAAGYAAYNLRGLVLDGAGRIDYAGHLGGAAYGLVTFFVFKRRR